MEVEWSVYYDDDLVASGKNPIVDDGRKEAIQYLYPVIRGYWKGIALTEEGTWVEVASVFFDGVHLMSPSLEQLHRFAEEVGLKRHFFHGVRKGHPHYDITNVKMAEKVKEKGVIMVSTRELVKLYKDWQSDGG